jgi:hypothetical protein
MAPLFFGIDCWKELEKPLYPLKPIGSKVKIFIRLEGFKVRRKGCGPSFGDATAGFGVIFFKTFCNGYIIIFEKSF